MSDAGVTESGAGPAAIHPDHVELFDRARYAPSAHNAQPWRVMPIGDGASYELWYSLDDKLDADPDDRDGLLALGAFYETLALVAASSGWSCRFEPGVVSDGHGVTLGVVHLERAADPAGPGRDPLGEAIDRRRTNRHRYSRRPLPDDLREELASLGCTFVAPRAVSNLVARASIMAWTDQRFVDDLREWTRFDDDAPDGLTPACLNLNAVDRLALRFALWRGRLPGWLAWVYSRRDVVMTRASSTVAVLSVDERSPLALFECGRRLLRAWVTLAAAGWSSHPISIVIDQPTAPELTALAGVDDAVAIFRLGHTDKPAVTSQRRGLDLLVAPRQGGRA